MKTTLLMLWYTVFSIVFFGVLLFWPAGTFDYWQAWVFIAVFEVGTMVPTIYLAVKYPDAFRRRMRSGPFAETRMVQKLINVGIILTTVAAGVVSALDHRFGWSTVPTAVVVVGNVLVLVGLAVAEVVVIQNNYAAATITVEAEQPVVSTGLYGLVRHPMYVGALIMVRRHAACARLVLGSADDHSRRADLRRSHHRRGEGAAPGTRQATTSTPRRSTTAWCPGCGDR